jgi:hypothetical protein
MNPKREEYGRMNNKEGEDKDPERARHVSAALCVIFTTRKVALSQPSQQGEHLIKHSQEIDCHSHTHYGGT